MAEALFPIICTAEVSASVLSTILNDAYTTSQDTPPSLILLTTTSPTSYADVTFDSYTRVPVPSFTSPFLSLPIPALATHLYEKARNTKVSASHFLVADEQTSNDRSMLFVQCHDAEKRELESVRVDARFLNSASMAVGMGASGIKELVALADADGVYRGGEERVRAAPRKGGEAPRKMLQSGS